MKTKSERIAELTDKYLEDMKDIRSDHPRDIVAYWRLGE